MDICFSKSLSISPNDLSLLIGRPNAPLLLDVRRHAAFTKSPSLIASARWVDPDDITSFIQNNAPCDAVVYCVYGHEVSGQATTALRAAGWNARKLEGGIAGGELGVDDASDIAKWQSTQLPKVNKLPDWGINGTAHTRWITRESPKIDRIACPWLVRRFIDSSAEFFYVPTKEVLAQASLLNATAFDIENAPISHIAERCSFDALLDGVDLVDPALHLLATIVRGADTGHLALSEQSAGLLAISLGMSQCQLSDKALLEAMMPIYDALYAWCYLRVTSQDTSHTWSAS